MKILNQNQVREADRYTILNEPVKSVDLMERAGVACAEFICKINRKGARLAVFAGQGNNGGDGLVIAREMQRLGYVVEVFVVGTRDSGSPDFEWNHARLREKENIKIKYIKDEIDKVSLESFDFIVDALFGSGLDRPVTGLFARVIEKINACGKPVIAIDIPSGLFRDKFTDSRKGAIIKATRTLALQSPALSLLMPGNEPFCGRVDTIPIGLHPDFLQQVSSPYSVFTWEDALATFRPRNRVAHKGSFGHALLLAGSRLKAGAALLAAKGALRSGAGLLTVYLPNDLVSMMRCALPEAMVLLDPQPGFISTSPPLTGFCAVAAGPGIGTASETVNALQELIRLATVPLILDADALNILSETPVLFRELPANSVLTPHPKEFERMAGSSANDFERLEKAIGFAKEFRCFIILKSAFSAIIDPLGNVSFNVSGNAGLAKGGSGDTLTGIILGLVARGYRVDDALKLGAFAHGYAAELLGVSSGLDAFLATDVSDMLGMVWKCLENGSESPVSQHPSV